MHKSLATIILLAALLACRGQEEEESSAPAPIAADAREPYSNQAGQTDDSNLARRGPDMTAAEAGEGEVPPTADGAALLLRRYFAMLEQGRFDDARRLWSNNGHSSGLDPAQFRKQFEQLEMPEATVGEPGDMEGAAGSVYVTIPVTLEVRKKGGATSSSAGSATLRRVNDVPGSTSEQRQWRIYRIELQPPL